jgi:hypothetical protein
MSQALAARRTTALLCAVLVVAFGVLPRQASGSRPECGPGDRPEPALQGQVPLTERLNGNAEPGYWCNLEVVGHFKSRGYGTFDTYRNCAYYADNVSVEIDSGVVVLDVSDPSRPIKTAHLTARAMRTPGESLRVNQARGLLVSDYYTPFPFITPTIAANGSLNRPGIHHALAVYDVSRDCAHPTLLADVLIPAALGHEGCFEPDGMVYYMSNYSITPIDLTDPAHPKPISKPMNLSADLRPIGSHGCSISDDGTRGYFMDVYNSRMVILDTSQIQARIPGAQPRVVSTFAWPDAPFHILQSTVPVSYGGRPYVLLWSEARLPKICTPGNPTFGYPMIIDVSDELHPVVVGKMKSEVVLPKNCAKVVGEGTVQTRGASKGGTFNLLILSPGFGYDSHYCTPDRLHDPTIVACAQEGSGLRVYDVRNPRAPREIAYYNTATASRTDPTLDWAVARPVIRRDLGQVWWVTVMEGFRTATFRGELWPFPGDPACPPGYDYFRAQYDLVYAACKA